MRTLPADLSRHGPPWAPVLSQGLTDLLHVDSLPAVGILLGALWIIYYLFSRKIVRWGADVDALVAEKDKRIDDHERELAAVKADREKWIASALETSLAARRVAETNTEAVKAAGAAVDVLARKRPPSGAELD